MAHTFKHRDRKRPHAPTTTKASTYAAEVKRIVQAPSDVVVLAEAKRDHNLDPVHLPNTAMARAFSKDAEKYLIDNPNALFKTPPKPADPPAPAVTAAPDQGGGRWAHKHVREASDFAKRVTACMAEKGMSQSALAHAIGIRPTSVWSMLHPKVGANQKPRNLAKIASVLGVDADWLLTGKGEPRTVAAAPPPPTPTPIVAPPKATTANPFPTAPPVNASTSPTLSAGDRRLLKAVADTQAGIAETLDSFGLTQAASMARLAAELVRRALT
jgi:hypothetical protein